MTRPGRALALAVAIAALLALLLFVQLPGTWLWQRVLLDASHGPIFALVAVLLLQLQHPDRRDGIGAALAAFLGAVGLGLAIEYLQTQMGRPGTLSDVRTDAAGAALGLALWQLLRPRGARWLPLAALLAGTVVIGWNPARAALAYQHRAASFPVVADFGSWRALPFITTNDTVAALVPLPQAWARRAGERGLRLVYDGRNRPALHLTEPLPDWSGQRQLVLDLVNPSAQPLRLLLRVFDADDEHSRGFGFHRRLDLPPRARQVIRVPLADLAAAPAGRAVDLVRVGWLMLLSRANPAAAELYVARIWLE